MPAEEYRTIATYLWILGIATYQYINFKILVILINITKISTLHMSLISQVCLMSQSWDSVASMHDHLLTVAT